MAWPLVLYAGCIRYRRRDPWSVASLGDSMSWLIAQVWILLLVSFVLGSAAAWLVYRLRPSKGAH